MKEIKRDWPSLKYFDAVRNHRRTYDEGLLATRDEVTRHLAAFPALARLYADLFSDRLESGVSMLVGDGRIRRCLGVIASDARWGSGMSPHQDTQFPDETGVDPRVSMIICVAGYGSGQRAGATQILSDNTFSSPIFVPDQISNSAMIFCSGLPAGAGFYHGVAPISRGCRRLALAVGFGGLAELGRASR
jgi:hypothetical protein